jgi:glycerophosphoryl diester phosphodiesterase
MKLCEEIAWRDPAEAFARWANDPYVAWLDSAAPQDARSRYSYLGVSPFQVIETVDGSTRVNGVPVTCDPFTVLARALDRWRLPPDELNLATISPALLLAAGFLATVAGAESAAAVDPAARPLLTLDGKPPLIIGHRGLPGLMPEETIASYDMAAELGTDALELDLHLTKDCVLVARHNAWLSDNTNIAEVAKTNPEVAAGKRTVPGVKVKVSWPTTPTSGPSDYLTDLTDPRKPKSVLKSLVVDGQDHTNDWAISDFTLAELKQWIRGTTYDARELRPTEFNGLFPILSYQEIIDIAKAKSQKTGRTIVTYPETKNPTWNNAQAIANGCGAPGSRPLEDALVRTLEANGLNAKNAPVYVQSFEPGSLKFMRSKGLQTKVVQLMGGYDVDFKNGAVLYNDITDSRPFDWTVAGDPRWCDAMLTPAGLAEIKMPTASARGNPRSCRSRSRSGRIGIQTAAPTKGPPMMRPPRRRPA